MASNAGKMSFLKLLINFTVLSVHYDILIPGLSDATNRNKAMAVSSNLKWKLCHNKQKQMYLQCNR